MSYAEKLRDPRWQKKRLEILQRDDFACVLCGDKKETLHVHHKKYNGDPWESEINDLCTHCKTCHLIVEWIKDRLVVISTKKSNIGTDEIMVFACTDSREIILINIVDNVIQQGTIFNNEQFESIIGFYKSNNNGTYQNR